MRLAGARAAIACTPVLSGLAILWTCESKNGGCAGTGAEMKEIEDIRYFHAILQDKRMYVFF